MTGHDLSCQETLSLLNTNDSTGLTNDSARKRLAQYGPNRLPDVKKKNWLRRFLAQFADFMILVLFFAAALGFGVSCYEGRPDYVEPLIIIAIIFLNALLGVVQEARAEHSLAALYSLQTPRAKVLREGILTCIPCAELVPGDIITLETGQFVPADCRILTCTALQISEASLTGEAIPIVKNAHVLLPPDCLPADRINCAFSSCTVVNGHGTAVVTKTGLDTELGTIARHLLSETENLTPLQHRLQSVGRSLGILCLLLCAGIFLLGTLQGRAPVAMFLTSVSLAVASIPEGLPAVVTIMLSIGVERMVRQHAIIRKLPAVETLGSATVICSDKTGTLTQNRMTAVSCYTGGRNYHLDNMSEINDETAYLFSLAAYCSNSDGEHGEPTENALVSVLGRQPNARKFSFRRAFELPFSSEHKCMLVAGQDDHGYLLIVKGAYDVLLSASVLSSVERARFDRQNHTYAMDALRVIAVATRRLDNREWTQVTKLFSSNAQQAAFTFLLQELTLVGLCALCDPPRPECAEAIATCRRAGITTIMITGDHPDTALSVAKTLGITKEGPVITGSMLSAMSDEELSSYHTDCRVYARVQPEHKVRIVSMLQKHGEIVAMTGDGVNDAPALRRADIGCAMGLTGTDVAKSASDMILMDDNFATIVAAVKEGRGIYDNIRKSIHFLLSCNAGELMLIVLAILLSLPSPLIAIQLLWINLVTDSLPAIALAMEPPEPDIMKQPPHPAHASFFTRAGICRLLFEGAMIAMLSLIGYLLYGTTCCFLVLGCSELIHTLNIRSHRSLFRSGLFGNTFLTLAITCGLALEVCTLALPGLRRLFCLTSLSTGGIVTTCVLSLLPLLIVELEKLLFRRS